MTQPGTLALTADAVVEVDGQPDIVNTFAAQHAIHELPINALPFLFSSRYCEVDRLTEFAWSTFGDGPTGYQRVQAVCNFGIFSTFTRHMRHAPCSERFG